MDEIKSRLAVVEDELAAHREEERRLKSDLETIKSGLKRLGSKGQSEHLTSLKEFHDNIEGLLTSCQADISRLIHIKTEIVDLIPKLGMSTLFKRLGHTLISSSPSVPATSRALFSTPSKGSKKGRKQKKTNV